MICDFRDFKFTCILFSVFVSNLIVFYNIVLDGKIIMCHFRKKRPICTFWNTAFDSGTGGLIIENIVTSNARAWMSNATVRFFTLAEQCHTHEILI